MQTRRLNEALIGALTLGKSVELGRQLVLSTDKKFAEKMGSKIKVKPEDLQQWGPGYVALDAVISVTGALAMIQAIRKDRKGAGRSAMIQGGTLTAYSLYYLAYTLFGLKGASFGTRLVNLAFTGFHVFSGIRIIKFAQRALK